MNQKESVLITGSSRGLGKALAYTFAKNGYNIILHGREWGVLETMRNEIISAYPRKVQIVVGDICNEGTILQLADIAERANISGLINNAGIYMNKGFMCTAPTHFRKIIDTNLLAPILLTHRLFPLFQRKQSGIIININSIAGENGSSGETAYCASKHGLRGFSKALQFDAVKNNIRVIDIILGAMKTDMTNERSDQEKLIEPYDAARLIFKIYGEHNTLRINEISIGRRNY
jgi:3-oxoacyl-[acyl-carrier protein] reductase